MSRFVGVVGSPRRNGNTHVLVSRVLDGAASAGAQIDTLFLGERSIRECDGCHLCWEGAHCPKADDMADVFPGSSRRTLWSSVRPCTGTGRRGS